MSSALKPALPPPGVPTASSPGKAPTSQPLSHPNPLTYGQNFAHVNQNVAAMPHPNGGAPSNVNMNMHNAPHIPQQIHNQTGLNIPQHHGGNVPVNNVTAANVQNLSPSPTAVCPIKPLPPPPPQQQQQNVQPYPTDQTTRMHKPPQANGTQEMPINIIPPTPVENKVEASTPSQPIVIEPSKTVPETVKATDVDAVAAPTKTVEPETPVSTRNDVVPTPSAPAPVVAVAEATKPPEIVNSEPTPSPAAVAVVVVAAPSIPVFSAKPKPPKAQSTLKLATTPRMTARKVKPAKADDGLLLSDSSVKATKSDKSLGAQKSPASGKSKRSRTRTQPYQSPLPELALISKLSAAATTPKNKSLDDKLIVFYKNEFLAVRNADGGFYICQAVQNVFKTSAKIRIRWLSQTDDKPQNDEEGDIYTPDFYDNTDFDCILTNLNLNRVQKGKYQLPAKEKDRTDNILKRALAVEKGESPTEETSLTEEHPDGLDLSLYRDESQLKSRKRKSAPAEVTDVEGSPKKKRKSSPKRKKVVASKVSKSIKTKAKKSKTSLAAKSPSTPLNKIEKKAASTPGGRAERAKRRQDSSPQQETSPVVSKKKAKVLAKVARRTAVPAVQVQQKPVAQARTSKTSKTVVSTSSTSRSTKASSSKPTTVAAASVTTAGRKSRKPNKK